MLLPQTLHRPQQWSVEHQVHAFQSERMLLLSSFDLLKFEPFSRWLIPFSVIRRLDALCDVLYIRFACLSERFTLGTAFLLRIQDHQVQSRSTF